MRGTEKGQRTRRRAGRVVAVAAFALTGVLGLQAGAHAASETLTIYGLVTTNFWYADSTKRCSLHGAEVGYNTRTNLPSGGMGIRVWDENINSIYGTRTGMNQVDKYYEIVHPPASNNCGIGYTGHYLDIRKEGIGSDDTSSGTLYY